VSYHSSVKVFDFFSRYNRDACRSPFETFARGSVDFLWRLKSQTIYSRLRQTAQREQQVHSADLPERGSQTRPWTSKGCSPAQSAIVICISFPQISFDVVTISCKDIYPGCGYACAPLEAAASLLHIRLNRSLSCDTGSLRLPSALLLCHSQLPSHC
jgi:hypothetical protein